MMFERIKNFFMSDDARVRKQLDALAEAQRKEREGRREYYRQWCKKHIKRWGVWRYKNLYLVRNPEIDYDDESTYYTAVYGGENMGAPDGTLVYFHRSELFPYKG